ncbi:Z1 domain-containing protein [Pedobacter steynii]|uniref:Z1 domain-containing protein n=1 Tax=Pedobacter steynii TaxID=430522 RepID=A0A1H0AVY8_9SPHI|nr:Z1 domain-containing protein [Pedobacter steynii]NQX41243.1 Z1 domain-containing protein [Pedobacter steynii]SDN37612.1 Z1 domain-containing protein [Pedobacter steynii]
MNYSNYIEVIKTLISKKAKEYAVEKKLDAIFFNTLLNEIRPSILTIFDIYNYPAIDDTTLSQYYETALKEYLSVNPIIIEPSNALTKKGFRTWLTTEYLGQDFKWNYTERYLKRLAKTGRSEKVITEIEESSLSIVEKIGNPRSTESFYTRGLVVGSVQSGKTGNFNAVINRSIDLGYGLIIILSGIMEDLRSQTQLRIESDVIGEGLDLETGTNRTKGVGQIRRFGKMGDSTIEQVISITSSKSDFNNALVNADFSLNHTNILVCKKNVGVLKNLIIWLHDYIGEEKDKHNIPFLIIDDEADNASLNNEGKKGREYASKINGHIRALLSLFNKKTYLGYTATPFANVLQDRNPASEAKWIIETKLLDTDGNFKKKFLDQEDYLFPDDFIILLNPPSNYIGAKQIFETAIEEFTTDKIPLIEVVQDYIPSFPSRVMTNEDGELVGVKNYESKEAFDENGGYLDFIDYKNYRSKTRSSKSGDSFPNKLPESLKESIVCFILATAIRESRKKNMLQSALYNPHNTMLIHISRFTLWQNKTRDLVQQFVSDLEANIGTEFPENPKSVYADFERYWYTYYASIIESIQTYLPLNYEDKFLAPISFEALKKYIPDAIKNIEIKAINNVTKDKLEYPSNSPKKIIAIGGNRLSRGFTLEGLTINYFIRSTNYSDTLLQMGRWFGYRPGYLDCCKLFITQDSVDKFNSTTRAIEELEIEFRKMEAKGKTPENFILRVKKHPGTLKITRPAILKRTKEVNWSYQDQLEQTTTFHVNRQKIEDVWKSFKVNVSGKHNFTIGNGFMTAKTDANGVIDLLASENNFSPEDRVSMIRFIELCQEKGFLNNWTIAIKTTGQASSKLGKGTLSSVESGLPGDIVLTVRRGPKHIGDRAHFLASKQFRASGKSANIISGGRDLSILLTQGEIDEAITEFRRERTANYLRKHKDWSKQKAEAEAAKLNVPERVFREKMKSQEGLIIIYLFDSYYTFLQEHDAEVSEFTELVTNEHINLDIPIVGIAIGFPPIEPDPGGVYVHGDYELENDEDLEDVDNSDLAIPEDFN